MKKLFTFLFGLSLFVLPSVAQDEVDMSFVFIDEEGTVLENGATVVRNTVEAYDEDGTEVIYSGISVMNQFAEISDYIKINYTIGQIDNGVFQICFPMTCNSKEEVGSFETTPGQLMDDIQDMQCEWFPKDDGECLVNLSIEVMTKSFGFPVSYNHKAYGPTLTLKFVKGDVPGPEPVLGDVNCDGEVNIADVNAVIAMIQQQSSDSNGDVNNDNEVNIADVNAVIDIILN